MFACLAKASQEHSRIQEHCIPREEWDITRLAFYACWSGWFTNVHTSLTCRVHILLEHFGTIIYIYNYILLYIYVIYDCNLHTTSRLPTDQCSFRAPHRARWPLPAGTWQAWLASWNQSSGNIFHPISYQTNLGISCKNIMKTWWYWMTYQHPNIQYHPISSNIKFGSWFCFFQPRILQSSSSSDSVWIKIWWLDDSQFFCSSLGTLRFPTHPRRRPVKVLPVLAPAYSGDHVARCSGCPWIGRPLNEVWCAFCSLWPKKSI